MDRHYQLKVTSQTTNIDVDSIDAEEVARIVQLAGIASSPAPMPASPAPVAQMPAAMDVAPEIPQSPHCAICGAEGHDEASCPDAVVSGSMDELEKEIEEDVAEFDHGHYSPSDQGGEIDDDTYIWQANRLQQHFGKQGDNTLNDPLNEEASSIYKALREAYEGFLAEGADHNEDGNLSPLSDPTKPEFDKDPFVGDTPVDDGSRSPMSTIKRQPSLK